MDAWLFFLLGLFVLSIFIVKAYMEGELTFGSRSPTASETESSSSTVTPAPTRSTHAARQTDYEALSSLPTIYYVLAIFCGVVLIGFTIANADELSSTQIGAWIGYTVGAVLSMFAVGRVIQLLQQIRDAVRSNPALSPSSPEDE